MESWTWTPGRLGPFRHDTPFSREAIQPHLPDYSLSECAGEPGNPGGRILAATPPGATGATLMFLGHADTPCLIGLRVREPGRIANAWSVGSRFGETLLRAEDCFASAEIPGRQGDIFCRQAGEADGPIYWFRTAMDDLGGIVPDEETVRQSVLYELGCVLFDPQ